MHSILSEWGIDIPKDTWCFEYLQKYFPNKFYYIDKIPYIVTNIKKYDEIDIYYQEIIRDKSLKKDFYKVENQYVEVLKKLWIYNDTYAKIDISNFNSKIAKKQIDKSLRYCLKRLINGTLKEHFKISTLDELKLIIQLAMHDVVYVEFLFKDFQIFLMSTFSCFAIYFNNKSMINDIKKIINTEGLYLRK